MKYFLTFVLFLISYFLFPTSVFAQESGWQIDNFQSDIIVKSDGIVDIKETISVNFAGLQKHGIYRYIPYSYSNPDGTRYYTEIVTNQILQDGKLAKYTSSQDENNVNIKIGDANKTISSTHTYQIEYSVKGVLKPFDTYDEIYWNVTGNGWGVPIQKAEANVYLPKDILQKTSCYNGYLGSTEKCGIIYNTKNSASFSTARALASSEVLTVAVGYDKNQIPVLIAIPPKPTWQTLNYMLLGIIYGATLLGGILFVASKWWRAGRDLWQGDKATFSKTDRVEGKPILAHETTFVQYSPPHNLRAAEVGVLMDEKADTLDVTSSIIDLAQRGYLTITEIPKKWLFGKLDYKLSLTSKTQTDLLPYEKLLMDKLFEAGKSTNASTLKQTFYDELKQVKDKLYEDVVAKKFFDKSPETVRGKYIALGIVLAIAGVAGTVFSLSNQLYYPAAFTAALIFDGILILIASKFMPRRTAYGHGIYREVKGYYLFIDKAEKYRQQFSENKNLFNEVLPYAIVFGLTEKFAKAMKDMGLKPEQPGWYYGTGPFNAVYFGNSITTFSNSFSTAIASTPHSSGSSGGGFSGGGFGGGGGGSW